MSSLETGYNYFFVVLSVLVFVSCLVQKYRRSNHHDWSLLNLSTVFFGVFGFFVWLICLPIMVGFHFGWGHIAWGIVGSGVCFFMYKRFMGW